MEILWVIQAMSLGRLLKESIQNCNPHEECPIRCLVQNPKNLDNPVDHTCPSLHSQMMMLSIDRLPKLVLYLSHLSEPNFSWWLWSLTASPLNIDLWHEYFLRWDIVWWLLLFDFLKYLFANNYGLALALLLWAIYILYLTHSFLIWL